MDEVKLLRHGMRAAHAIVDGQRFEDDLADGMRCTVGADCVLIQVWLDFRKGQPALTLNGEPDSVSETEFEKWVHGYAEHPYMVNLLSTWDPRPYRTSDFMTFNRYRETLPYREVFGEYGMRYEIGMAPRINDRDQVLICLKRALHDFSDREAQAFHPLVDLVGAALDYQVQVHAIQAKIRAATFPADPRRLTLTERETQVLALIATGCTNDQAARRLGISPRTVRKHLESVFAKANVPCRAAAVAWWCRQTQP